MNKQKVVPILSGYEKAPGEELVIKIEIRHVQIPVLQDIFKNELFPGEFPVSKKYECMLYKKTGIRINTKKLRFYIGLYSDNEDNTITKFGNYFLPPKNLREGAIFSGLIEVVPETPIKERRKGQKKDT